MPRIIPLLESGLGRRLTWLTLILLIACANPNADAPLNGNLHIQDYLLTHDDDALLDLNRCVVCHRDDFKGTGPETDCTVCHKSAPTFDLHEMPYTEADLHGPSAREDLSDCFGCHGTQPNLFDGGIVSDPDFFNAASANCSSASCHPAAGAHPTRWQGDNDITNDYLSSHRSAGNQAANCSLCHDYTLGRTAPNSQAPSCFSAGFTNADGSTTSCHPGGPGIGAHDLPFSDANDHGPKAKADLLTCQVCHGTLGTILFNGGFAATSCASTLCHPAAGAHPTRWQGDNDITEDYLSSHRSAGNQSTNCAVCHDYTQGRSAPNNQAPSCFSAGFTNADGSTGSCHPAGPGTNAHDLPFTEANDHGPEAKADLASCRVCHGTQDNTLFNGGIAPTSCSTALCHPDAGAHPTRWQGSNDITNDYLSSHRSAGNQDTSCAICHDYTQGRTAPNSQAPSCFSTDFTNADGSTTGCHPEGGGSAPHDLPYTSPQAHGDDAKSDLSACQECHGTQGTILFNGGTASTSCATTLCHPAAGAHPTRWQGRNDNTSSYISSHRDSRNRSTSCSICHDYTNGRTAPNPNAPSCFTRSFTNDDGVTSECHD